MNSIAIGKNDQRLSAMAFFGFFVWEGGGVKSVPGNACGTSYVSILLIRHWVGHYYLTSIHGAACGRLIVSFSSFQFSLHIRRIE